MNNFPFQWIVVEAYNNFDFKLLPELLTMASILSDLPAIKHIKRNISTQNPTFGTPKTLYRFSTIQSIVHTDFVGNLFLFDFKTLACSISVGNFISLWFWKAPFIHKGFHNIHRFEIRMNRFGGKDQATEREHSMENNKHNQQKKERKNWMQVSPHLYDCTKSFYLC